MSTSSANDMELLAGQVAILSFRVPLEPVAQQEEKKEEEKEDHEEEDQIVEPFFLCCICGEKMAVTTRGHNRICLKSEDNHQCPFCHRKRRYYMMESHMKTCGDQLRIPVLEKEKAIYNYRCTDLMEWNLNQMSKDVENNYKTALNAGRETPYFGLCSCETGEDHWTGVCLHNIQGSQFKRGAQKYALENVLLNYSNYLEVEKTIYCFRRLGRYQARWAKLAPEKFDDPEATERVLRILGKQADLKNEKKKQEKMTEVDGIINDYRDSLTKTITKYRQRFLKQIAMDEDEVDPTEQHYIQLRREQENRRRALLDSIDVDENTSSETD